MNTDTPQPEPETALSGEDSLRLNHISAVKERLTNLGSPSLQTVIGKETQLPEGSPHLEVDGYFGLQIDLQALSAVLTACDVPPERASDIVLKVREAKLADRDFSGSPIGGISYGTTAEIYNAYPTNYPVTDIGAELSHVRQAYAPVDKRHFTNSLLHELRHTIQHVKALYVAERGFSSFFAEDQADHDQYQYERDATIFANELEESLAPFIDIVPHPTLPADIYSTPMTSQEIAEAGFIARYLDSSKPVARVVETDPPGLYLLREVTHQGVSSETTPESADQLIARIKQAQGEHHLGYAERRYLLNRAKDRAVGQGKDEVCLKFAQEIGYLEAEAIAQ